MREETKSFLSKRITQDTAYRQSLMKYAEKYGVSRAIRTYNKSRPYISFGRARWDGSVASLACQSRRPHSHPNQHTEAELKLIRDMRRRNPRLGMAELWHRPPQPCAASRGARRRRMYSGTCSGGISRAAESSPWSRASARRCTSWSTFPGFFPARLCRRPFS